MVIAEQAEVREGLRASRTPARIILRAGGYHTIDMFRGVSLAAVDAAED